MFSPNRPSVRLLPLRPLAACLAVAFGIADAAVPKAAHPTGAVVVTNCADSGPGSLRGAVQDDTAGDPIDLSQLPCSLITLTSGSIHTTQSLTLQGPGSGLLTIDGNDNDRLFSEDASYLTRLAIYGMTLQNGYGAFVSGGCIYSAGDVVLDDVVVTGCRVVGQGVGGSTYYAGGGLDVKGGFTATDSRIVGNEVYASPGAAYGGGVFATAATLVNTTISGNTVQNVGWLASGGGAFFRQSVRLSYSTVSDNVQEGQGYPGGLTVLGFATIDHSTISGNTGQAIGGLFLTQYSTISDSTISGNTGNYVGGLFFDGVIANSTIAFNYGECGIEPYNLVPTIESSIVALNGTGGVAQHNICFGRFFTRVDGANDLIGESDGVTLPPDTIQSDPMLGPLEDNGGPTLTHALLPGSPAIDTGNNSADLDSDQRGQGFPRVIGLAADIGAFESTATNQPPVADDDSYTTAENATLTVDAPGVLANDSDPDGDSLTAALVDNPSNGLVTLNADGSFVYRPAADFFGTDTFTYEANDGQLDSNVATVTITVSQSDDDTVFANGFD